MSIDVHPDDDTVNQPVTKKKDVDKTASDLNASLIVGALLIIPVVLLIAITITVRLYRAGRFKMLMMASPCDHVNLFNIILCRTRKHAKISVTVLIS